VFLDLCAHHLWTPGVRAIHERVAHTPLSPTVRNGHSDSYWVVFTGDSRYAFAASFRYDGAISSYRVELVENLVLLNDHDETAGSSTANSILSANSKYLYVRSSNQNMITAF